MQGNSTFITDPKAARMFSIQQRKNLLIKSNIFLIFLEDEPKQVSVIKNDKH